MSREVMKTTGQRMVGYLYDVRTTVRVFYPGLLRLRIHDTTTPITSATVARLMTNHCHSR